MTIRKSKQTNDLLEALSELEHEQWSHWSHSVAGEVSVCTRKRWQQCWVDYAELPDAIKAMDRCWARKVLSLLRQRDLI